MIKGDLFLEAAKELKKEFDREVNYLTELNRNRYPVGRAMSESLFFMFFFKTLRKNLFMFPIFHRSRSGFYHNARFGGYSDSGFYSVFYGDGLRTGV